jgi:virginiamycin B lyase
MANETVRADSTEEAIRGMAVQTKSGKGTKDAGAVESYLDPRRRGHRPWSAAIAVVALLAFVVAIAGKGASPVSISVAGFLGTSTPDTAPVPGTAPAAVTNTPPPPPPSTPETSAPARTDPTTVTTTVPAAPTTTAAPTVASSVPPPLIPLLPPMSFPPVSVPPPSARVTLFHVPTPASQPLGLVAGPDGNLWFTEGNRDVVGRVTPDGVITEFHTPTAGSQPGAITLGPDGALWFAEVSGNNIGRITTSGTVTEFAIPTAYSHPSGIAVGADGALWFTEWNVAKVSRVTVDGHMTEYPAGAATPNQIVRGADGDMWFTDGLGELGRISPSGALSPVTLANMNMAWAVTVDRLGNLWYAGGDQSDLGRIERRDPAGHVTEFVVGRYVEFNGITEGPDGAMWFTESNMNAIGRLAPDGTITTDSAPSPVRIVVGPDANIWFTSGTNGNAVGRIRID